VFQALDADGDRLLGFGAGVVEHQRRRRPHPVVLVGRENVAQDRNARKDRREIETADQLQIADRREAFAVVRASLQRLEMLFHIPARMPGCRQENAEQRKNKNVLHGCPRQRVHLVPALMERIASLTISRNWSFRCPASLASSAFSIFVRSGSTSRVSLTPK